jgi:hypothetical protein
VGAARLPFHGRPVGHRIPSATGSTGVEGAGDHVEVHIER